MSDEIGPFAIVVDIVCSFLIYYYCIVEHIEYTPLMNNILQHIVFGICCNNLGGYNNIRNISFIRYYN